MKHGDQITGCLGVGKTGRTRVLLPGQKCVDLARRPARRRGVRAETSRQDPGLSDERSGRRDERGISKLIKLGDKLKLSDVDELSLDKVTGSLVLVALAAGNPSNRTALLDRAEKLNTLDAFPHHLIRKAVAALRSQQ